MNKTQKRIIILNIPYAIAGLFATNFGEAWRIAIGVNASEKIDHFIDALPVALSNPMPSFHPLDIAVGAAIESLLRSPRCPFVLYVGKKKLVKRKEFEKFITDNIEI